MATAAKYIVQVKSNGDVFWLDYNNPDKLHRLGGLPAVEYANGDKTYWVNGRRHRLDGLPACEYANGDKTYYENGLLHRIDGPAIEWSNGDKEYWIEDEEYSYEEWLAKVSPKKEMTIAEIESALGYSIKIVK